MTASLLSFGQLATLFPAPHPDSELLVGPRRGRRFQVTMTNAAPPLFSVRCGIATSERCGDSRDQYHPKYLMALLGSIAANEMPSNVNVTLARLSDFAVPAINFTTNEWERRSMTLNAMRMSREFLDAHSPRLLQLVTSRLKAGQSDVVHDVLVYLVGQVEQMRQNAVESRLLRAESLAAYLGLSADAVQALFMTPRLDAPRITTAIESGRAGQVRRSLNIADVVASQLALLHHELASATAGERQVWKLIDQVVLHLYQLVK